MRRPCPVVAHLIDRRTDDRCRVAPREVVSRRSPGCFPSASAWTIGSMRLANGTRRDRRPLVLFVPTPSGADRRTMSPGVGISMRSATVNALASAHRSPVQPRTSRMSAKRWSTSAHPSYAGGMMEPGKSAGWSSECSGHAWPRCGSEGLVSACGYVLARLRTRSQTCASAAGHRLLWKRHWARLFAMRWRPDTIGLRWDTHSASTPARRPAWVNSTTLRAVPCGRSSGARAGRRAAEARLDGTGGLDRHFAVTERFAEGRGSVECRCADGRWCHRPTLSRFR